ncbi:hypothetical protein HK097_001038 [Rhizophlyctis rosea]|uniref:Uncharacterized protein n=1 Tax=Rhizophlyctis rosea TaxID=64517 RepID=A0AAD5X547_9FUNG|nr:hypothetical protein HK097_001038 [Rhizophlyctis rosea]
MTARSSSFSNLGSSLYRTPSSFFSETSQKPIRYDKTPSQVLDELYDGKPVMHSTVGTASAFMLNHRDAKKSSMSDLSGPVFGDAAAQRDFGAQAKEAW